MPCYSSCLYTFLPTSHFHLLITVIPSAVLCFPLPPLIASHSSGVPYCPSCGTLPPPLTYLPGSTLFPLFPSPDDVVTASGLSVSTQKVSQHTILPSLLLPHLLRLDIFPLLSLWAFTRHSILWPRPFWTGSFRWKATRISSTPSLPSNRPPWAAVRLRPFPLCRLALRRGNSITNLIHLRLLRRFALSQGSNDIKISNAHKGARCYRHQLAALKLVHI